MSPPPVRVPFVPLMLLLWSAIFAASAFIYITVAAWTSVVPFENNWFWPVELAIALFCLVGAVVTLGYAEWQELHE